MDIRRMLFELPSSQNALKQAEFYMTIIQSLIEFIGQFDVRLSYDPASNIARLKMYYMCKSSKYYRLFILRIKFDLDINLFHYY